MEQQQNFETDNSNRSSKISICVYMYFSFGCSAAVATVLI